MQLLTLQMCTEHLHNSVTMISFTKKKMKERGGQGKQDEGKEEGESKARRERKKERNFNGTQFAPSYFLHGEQTFRQTPWYLLPGVHVFVQPPHSEWKWDWWYSSNQQNMSKVIGCHSHYCVRLYKMLFANGIDLGSCSPFLVLKGQAAVESYSHKEINSDNNLRELGSTFSVQSQMKIQLGLTPWLQLCQGLR